MTSSSTITIRRATAADDDLLHQLSQLDSARTLRRPAVLAVVDGLPVAAASLSDGRTVADPFSDSADAVRMLRAYRSALGVGGRRRRGGGHRRLPSVRLRPAI
ncbi:MAG: hypothetical protein QOH30_1466 [Baekduia sp.]|nr:hypothetical protein [Baekduia sp.]